MGHFQVEKYLPACLHCHPLALYLTTCLTFCTLFSFCISLLVTYLFIRERPVVIEVLDSEEEEEPTCTFDDDADPSIERCWEPTDGNFTTSNKVIGGHPLALAGTGAAVVAALLVVGSLMRKQVKSRKTSQVGDVATNADADDAASNSASVHSKAGASVHSKAASVASKSASIVKGQLREVEDAGSVQSRVKELKSSLEREAKEKENLFNQNNFLKSALEERKATVQMFTSELQVRVYNILFHLGVV